MSSSVLRWPDARAVEQAVRAWARAVMRARPDVLRVGYFGSYARGDWGPGSDLDLVVVVVRSDEPFGRRPLAFDVTGLPVAADLLVYTVEEWRRLEDKHRGGGRTIVGEAVWVAREEKA